VALAETPPWYLCGYDEPVPFPVPDESPNPNTWLREHWRNLAEIHAAPNWLWPTLVARMLEGQWTVATTRQMVGPESDSPPFATGSPPAKPATTRGFAAFAAFAAFASRQSLSPLVPLPSNALRQRSPVPWEGFCQFCQ
jgi:hypothetical protein